MRANDGTRTAAEVLIDQLVVHGVAHVFCVPGESYLAALDAFHDRDIPITVCRQESGAAIMAEAASAMCSKSPTSPDNSASPREPFRTSR